MQAFIFFLLFAGAFLILHGIYEEKLAKAEAQTKIEYRFIPKSLFEQQMEDSNLDLVTKDMFNKESPFFYLDTLDVPLKSSDVSSKTPSRV